MSGIQHYDLDLHRCLETCDLTPVVSSLRVLKAVAAVTRKAGRPRAFHLKVNTGMNRLGVEPGEVEECLRLLRSNPQLKADGLMSHLAMGEKPSSSLTLSQVRVFRDFVRAFREAGISPAYLHLCNSSGLAGGVYPEGNLARVGLHLYGMGDSVAEPIARWTAQVYQIRELKKGDAVGYGARFRSRKKMRMAVLGVGYGDGYRRVFSNRADVLLRGKRCRVIGAVSMDLTAIDVSGVPEASTEDRAVLIGRDGKDQITAEELARHSRSIPWEILTGISPRVPRVFT
jgi:alanine racemase